MSYHAVSVSNRQAPAWATLEDIARAEGQGAYLAGFAPHPPGEAVPAQGAGRPPAKTPEPEPVEYLSIKALSSYSSISTRTLRTFLKDPVNPIPCRRIGGKILVRRGEFDSWADQFRRAANDDETGRVVDEMLRGLTGPRPLADTRRPMWGG